MQFRRSPLRHGGKSTNRIGQRISEAAAQRAAFLIVDASIRCDFPPDVPDGYAVRIDSGCPFALDAYWLRIPLRTSRGGPAGLQNQCHCSDDEYFGLLYHGTILTR